jgi:hypothetical protein
MDIVFLLAAFWAAVCFPGFGWDGRECRRDGPDNFVISDEASKTFSDGCKGLIRKRI